MASDCASGGRVPLTGHPWPAAESARSLAPTLRAFRPPLAAPQGAPLGRHPAAEARQERRFAHVSRRGQRSRWRSAGMHGFVDPRAVRGAEHRRRRRRGPKGRAQETRASAAVHGCTVSRPRRRREAQGILPRTMRGKTPRWALAFLVTFWAMPKS